MNGSSCPIRTAWRCSPTAASWHPSPMRHRAPTSTACRDYCGGCAYDVKQRRPNACPFNLLYWDFLIRNAERLRQQAHGDAVAHPAQDAGGEARRRCAPRPRHSSPGRSCGPTPEPPPSTDGAADAAMRHPRRDARWPTRFEWMRLTAEELRARAAADALVIVPVASLEQHGPHLATGVDIVLGTAVATTRRAAWQRPARRWWSPPASGPAWPSTTWPSAARSPWTTQSFAGVLRGIVRSAARHGFKRVMLLNGHGGNAEAVAVARGNSRSNSASGWPGAPTGTWCRK